MGYQTIDVRKLTPTIGAEIFGVDLSRELGNQQFQEIHDALMANLVIFFRDQTLTPEQHKDFGRRFGRLHVHPAAGWITGSPKRRPKAMCCSTVSVWSRKKTTRCAMSASWISWNC